MSASANPPHHRRGGAAVSVLNAMEAWEAEAILDLRLWCDGPHGQEIVWTAFSRHLPRESAKEEMHAFERLVSVITQNAHRPLVRHEVGCSCAGADECVFAHLVGTASEGHLNDAALIASLLVSPAQAEHVAILAGQVGCAIREIAERSLQQPPGGPDNILQLHKTLKSNLRM